MFTKKQAVGVAALVAMALPMIASAAADQEAAMKDANNWVHPRVDAPNYLHLSLLLLGLP
ncbi:MAG: hypothetical protein RIS87_1295, partial [Pseudomonadota bacterium]